MRWTYFAWFPESRSSPAASRHWERLPAIISLSRWVVIEALEVLFQ